MIRGNKNASLIERFIFKFRYIKLDFSSFFYTILNKIVWLLNSVKLGRNVRFFGWSKVSKYPGSTISIGDECVFRSDKVSNLIGINKDCIISTHGENSKISIAAGCGFSGVSLGCLVSIVIGKNTMVGANVIITDFDWHNLNPLKRNEPCISGKPITIGENVFIGTNAVILKGVSIGYNSVIGANSVVTTNIPANCIAAGNPAKVMKSLNLV